jgi:hypothetical protein
MVTGAGDDHSSGREPVSRHCMWTLMVERNALEGEPHPLPGLTMFDEEVLRLRQLAAPAS